LVIYFLAVTADWLQGPMVYALYDAYGFSKGDIAVLFIAGFGSSLLLGTFAGSLADQFGRRRLALAYCMLYIASCLTKHSPRFVVLLVGRLLGGMATSLLFSVFESWYVNEHGSRGFPAEWMGETFSRASFGNGMAAILSGQLAGLVAAPLGLVAPFDLAIGFLVLVGALISQYWSENYGNQSEQVIRGLCQAMQYTLREPSIRWLGIVQSCFEAAMYIFVFMWTPALQRVQADPNIPIPHGMIFSTFMVALMFGSVLFERIFRRTMHGSKDSTATSLRIAASRLLLLVLVISTLSLVGTAAGDLVHWSLSYTAMLVFEVTCGLYFPAIGCLRSTIIPEECRSAIMNFFRMPMNFLVVLMLANVDRFSNRAVFMAAASLLALALFALHQLRCTMSSSEGASIPNV
jgi:MFS family permease